MTKPIFFLRDMLLLAPKNKVITKYGATNALVKNERKSGLVERLGGVVDKLTPDINTLPS